VTPIDGRHLVFVCPTVGGASVVNAFVSIEVLNLPSRENDARVRRQSCLILPGIICVSVVSAVAVECEDALSETVRFRPFKSLPFIFGSPFLLRHYVVNRGKTLNLCSINARALLVAVSGVRRPRLLIIANSHCSSVMTNSVTWEDIIGFLQTFKK